MSEYQVSQINNFLLRKQHLLSESKIQSIPQVTKDIWGLHATNASTPYISLFNRANNFSKESLNREIIEKRLVKIRCVRKTIYIVPKENVSIAFSATKDAIQINSEKYYKFMGVTESEYDAASKSILALLGNNGMNASEIKKGLDKEINLSPIINYMCDLGILVRSLSNGGWKSNTHTYFRMDRYLPDVNLSEYSQEEARKRLVLQYLSSFGPVTLTDVSWWAGIPKTEIKRIVSSLEAGIDYVNISGLGEHLVSSNDANLLKNVKENNNPEINFLPGLDPYIMGYKERGRYLKREYYNYIFDRSGSATSTIINNGKIIGVWDYEEKPSLVVKIFLFEGNTDLKEIEKKGKEIGNFILDKNANVKICKDMFPLDKRTTGSFMAPLKDINS